MGVKSETDCFGHSSPTVLVYGRQSLAPCLVMLFTVSLTMHLTFIKVSVTSANSDDHRIIDMVFEPGNPYNLVVALSGFAGAFAILRLSAQSGGCAER